jgi:hypothetical protein
MVIPPLEKVVPVGKSGEPNTSGYLFSTFSTFHNFVKKLEKVNK